jgi:hypothetical protein
LLFEEAHGLVVWDFRLHRLGLWAVDFPVALQLKEGKLSQRQDLVKGTAKACQKWGFFFSRFSITELIMY